MSDLPSLENDLRAIEAINQRDVKFALAGDADMIISQWTDDFVVLQAAGTITRGRSANAAAAKNSKEQMKAFMPIEYNLDVQEITIAGDYAFEWGTYRGTARSLTGGESVNYIGKFMRILQRQPDGSWKMHRTMATTDAQPG